MFELDCSAVFPGCERVIRADSEAGVIRRAIAQANALGIDRISPMMMDTMRQRIVELPAAAERAA
ncbi:DUF1059 domain-containing protein [Jiella pacifica]|uniref:DUF1059 domain-containing protein n=1 Tax=Jiella pacifica TaxID=2696469 RepID=A0A6N9SZ52_9HYPH|nr:DUF1059 domain-containing protein [Jiella pacifica]NDW03046.1 DUF1059 domain-containing protein [Jiella pacifica]